MFNALDKNILKNILESEQPVPNRDLSLLCQASINTIRKEISIINEETKKHGFYITSKTSVGNYIMITDPEKADAYILRLKDLFKRNERMGVRYSERVYYLTRRLLSASSCISVESLSRELYCSRGVILKDLNDVKAILGKFNITVRNRRNGQGLTIEGSEWDIRQCLIMQDKIYKNTIDPDGEYDEYEFRSQFFMTENEDMYEIIRKYLIECMEGQDFELPVVHYPKIVRYIQLSISRRKRTPSIHFGDEQIRRARNTSEYDVARELCSRVNVRFGKEIYETDVIALAMLFLSFETRNSRLTSSGEYREFSEDTMEFMNLIIRDWGYSTEFFKEDFIEDWRVYLYALKNRIIFGVFEDIETVGFVSRQGISSEDFCIFFAHFYEKKHRILLNRDQAMSGCYFFHILSREDQYCYYAQNILVISQYGYPCAKLMASIVRNAYGKEVGLVTPCEFGEHLSESDTYDLLVTDLNVERRRYLDVYNLPILTMEPHPGMHVCPELDSYLIRLQVECERLVIGEESFIRTDLPTKDEVLGSFAQKMSGLIGSPEEEILSQLKENDAYIDLEHDNGLVIIPVFKPGARPAVLIYLNQDMIPWNDGKMRIFICYTRTDQARDNRIINDILSRFVHMSTRVASELLKGNADPVKLLYPEADSFT